MNEAPKRSATLEAHDRRRLECFRAMFHREVAVAAGLDYCHEHDAPVPPWLVKEALDILCSLLKRETSTKRGRSNGALARYRQDMIDLERWDEVQYVRGKQVELAEEAVTIPERSQDEQEWWRQNREQFYRWVGHTQDRAFECASALLTGSSAYGGKDAMKASYRRVEKSIDRRPYRHTVLDYSILQRLELEVLGAPKRQQVRKMSELYDLTPP